jgi:hypothetical protein
VGPRAGLDDMEKCLKVLDPTGTHNLPPTVVQPVASHYTDCTSEVGGQNTLICIAVAIVETVVYYSNLISMSHIIKQFPFCIGSKCIDICKGILTWMVFAPSKHRDYGFRFHSRHQCQSVFILGSSWAVVPIE